MKKTANSGIDFNKDKRPNYLWLSCLPNRSIPFTVCSGMRITAWEFVIYKSFVKKISCRIFLLFREEESRKMG